jgi:hypothetical protein
MIGAANKGGLPIKRLIHKPARYVLGRLGLELRPIRARDEVTPTLELPDPCDARFQHGDVAFAVPLSHCVYPYLMSYGPEGWHPFVAVLKEYLDNPALRYQDSVLRRYYERFQPKTVLDVFFPPEEQSAAHRETQFAHLAIPPHVPIFPWDPSIYREEGEVGLDASHGNQGFGPVSDVKGELEFRRLTVTLDSIRARGYQPSNGHDGDIRGYLLLTDDDYRFVIRQGFHRTAALAALGAGSIRVRFFLPYPRAVHLHDLRHWPQVKQGNLDPATAAAIFYKFFTEDGVGRAARLGLQPQAAPTS